MAVTKVVMPKLSEAMESGKIIKWLKQEGDRVAGGDILAEGETDKADVEMEAFGGGVLRKILVSAGEKAPVGTLIAVIAETGEDISTVLATAGAGGGGGGRGADPPPPPPRPPRPRPPPPRPPRRARPPPPRRRRARRGRPRPRPWCRRSASPRCPGPAG